LARHIMRHLRCRHENEEGGRDASGEDLELHFRWPAAGSILVGREKAAQAAPGDGEDERDQDLVERHGRRVSLQTAQQADKDGKARGSRVGGNDIA
jgi:hypothetical protein